MSLVLVSCKLLVDSLEKVLSASTLDPVEFLVLVVSGALDLLNKEQELFCQ